MLRTCTGSGARLTSQGYGSSSVIATRTLKRRPAYPKSYKPELAPLTHKSKDHSSFFQRHIKAWLGPRNLRGEYYRNKYYYPPQNHTPNYIVVDGNPVVDPSKPATGNDRRMNNRRDPTMEPFPENPYCKTARVIPDSVKESIYQQVQDGAHTQELAHKYGIKLERVEALVRLHGLEQTWKQEVSIHDEIA